MVSWVIVLAVGCSESPDAAPEASEPASARILSTGCAGSPYATIQSAINAAVSGDIIEVCSGTFRERLDISAKALTLRSQVGAATTILDATGGTGLKIRNGANVVLQGFTIRNGSSTGTGGNVSCSSSTFELRNNVFEAGRAAKGGGFGASSCTGLATGNRFRANHADEKGGGLYASPGVDLTSNDFEDNDALEGGGAYLKDSNQLAAGNTFLRNVVEDDGGGLFVFRGSPQIDANLFQENESNEEGGGLRLRSASGNITNNTFVANEADWRGGGAKISHDEVTMSGNVYDGNSSWGKAGGLLLYESASLLQHETFRNNIADHGGGIAILEGWGSVTIEDSHFEDNEARERGGHLFVDLVRYKTKLKRVDFVRGTADMGGAVYATNESIAEEYDPYYPDPNFVWYYTGVQFQNTLFEDNHATLWGGAMAVDGTFGWVRNSLFIRNDAPAGAALHVANGRTDFAVVNGIFRSNTTGAAVERVSGSSPVIEYTDFNGNTSDFSLGMANVVGTDGNRSSSPRFVDEAGGDYHLDPSSSLVNRGDPDLEDLDGTRSDISLYGGPNAAP